AKLLIWRLEQVARVLAGVAAHPRLPVVDVDAIHKLIDIAPEILDAPVHHRVLAVAVAHQAATAGGYPTREVVAPGGVVQEVPGGYVNRVAVKLDCHIGAVIGDDVLDGPAVKDLVAALRRPYTNCLPDAVERGGCVGDDDAVGIALCDGREFDRGVAAAGV